MATHVECDQCGTTMRVGDSVWEFDKYFKEKSFCSYECAKNYAVENIDEILEDDLGEAQVEDEDPYARYGVSRSDF